MAVHVDTGMASRPEDLKSASSGSHVIGIIGSEALLFECTVDAVEVNFHDQQGLYIRKIRRLSPNIACRVYNIHHRQHTLVDKIALVILCSEMIGVAMLEIQGLCPGETVDSTFLLSLSNICHSNI